MPAKRSAAYALTNEKVNKMNKECNEIAQSGERGYVFSSRGIAFDNPESGVMVTLVPSIARESEHIQLCMTVWLGHGTPALVSWVPTEHGSVIFKQLTNNGFICTDIK